MALRTENRLRKRSEFLRAYEGGRQVHCGYFHLFVLNRGDEGPSRFGFTVTKKFGKAVRRNRIRRQLRHCARQSLPDLLPGWDIVVNVRYEAAGRKMQELWTRFAQCLNRAGLMGPAAVGMPPSDAPQ